jgi:hypothetical protein
MSFCFSCILTLLAHVGGSDQSRSQKSKEQEVEAK